jgi:hypothetical protein
MSNPQKYMSKMQFTSIKSGKHIPFALNVFNDWESHGKEYTNIYLEGWYRLPEFHSLVPFERLSQSYGGYKTPLKKKMMNWRAISVYAISGSRMNPTIPMAHTRIAAVNTSSMSHSSNE